MAAPERKISRREMLVNYIATPAKLGLAGLVVGSVGGFVAGGEVKKGDIFPRGDLTPEIQARLAGYFIYQPKGDTIAKLRKAGMNIPSFPLTVAQGQPDPETVASKRKWVAVKEGGFYRPSEDGATPKELDSLVSKESSVIRALDGGFQAVSAEAVELWGLEHDHLQRTGESLFTELGFVLTATKIGNDRIAIGRSTPGEPLDYSIVDVSAQNPVPSTVELRGVGVVVAK